MKLDNYDKDNICGKVASPFFALAKRIDGKTTKKLAIQVFRDDIVPPLLKVRDMFPDFWKRLDTATHFVYETPPQPGVNRSRYYRHHDSNTIEIPADLAGLKIPELDGITVANSYSTHRSPEVSQALMKSKASEEDRVTVEKAHDLRVKGERVKDLLAVFLQDFTMPEQVPYSLPQLNYFMQRMDFRKRNRYQDRPPMNAQKRPRVVKTPSQELRQLVMESVMLHQALPKEDQE